jgi:hypothetical protein
MWPFWKSKTVWAAIITALIGLAFCVAGAMDLPGLLQIESLCVMMIFLRRGVAKSEL